MTRDDNRKNQMVYVDCAQCGGSGFNGRGTGYDDVCSECGGQRYMPVGQSVIDAICRDVAELPDRNSPEGWPEAMLVTAVELAEIIDRHLRPQAHG